MERRADEAERELLQWKKVRFMADKVGDEYEGFITGVAPFGLFIELSEHYVEGLVHVSSMADDYYRFVEQQHVLRGENTKKIYRLGDKVVVQVVKDPLKTKGARLSMNVSIAGRYLVYAAQGSGVGVSRRPSIARALKTSQWALSSKLRRRHDGARRRAVPARRQSCLP